MNCTQWATLIHWFLNANGIPAKLISRPTAAHRMVVVPVKGISKSIRLLVVDVDEHAQHLRNVKIRIKPLCDYDTPSAYIWEGLVDQDKVEGSSWDYRYGVTHNPTMEYIKLINDGWKNKEMPTATLSALVKGFLQEMEECQQRGLIKTNYENKYRDYNVQICPQDHPDHRLYVPINFDYLAKPNKKNNNTPNQYQVIGNKKQTTPMIMAEISYDKKDALWDAEDYIRIKLSDDGLLGASLVDKWGKELKELYILNRYEIEPKKFISFWSENPYAKKQ